MKFKIPRADKLMDRMPMRSKTVMDKPYLGRVRYRNRSWSGYHRRFCSRNNVVALLNFFAKCFSTNSLKVGLVADLQLRIFTSMNCVLGSTNWKLLIMPSAKNASSSSPASSCSHRFVLSGEFGSTSQFCVADLVCCCNEDCATWTKP